VTADVTGWRPTLLLMLLVRVALALTGWLLGHLDQLPQVTMFRNHGYWFPNICS
jgi:hypothetical protein